MPTFTPVSSADALEVIDRTARAAAELADELAEAIDEAEQAGNVTVALALTSYRHAVAPLSGLNSRARMSVQSALAEAEDGQLMLDTARVALNAIAVS